MINNLPDWITAGTAITAVMGGLFSVHATTQSRLDVYGQKLNTTIEALEQVAPEVVNLKSRMAASEVSAQYLKEGQDRLHESISSLAEEIRNLNAELTAK
jgi:hypothetical protein